MSDGRDLVRLRITVPGQSHIDEGVFTEGDTFLTRRRNVDKYINRLKIAELHGPSETKPAEAAEKKESVEGVQAGLSTDSAPSNESGQEQSSVSPPVPASPITNAGVSAPRKRGPKPKSSR